MVKYRRNKETGSDSVFFITMVTYKRHHLFATKEIRDLAQSEMKRIQDKFKIVFKAWVILPDHIHWLIKPVDADYSKVVSSFKRGFNLEFKRGKYKSKFEKNWHPRFWEHTVRDQDDYINCVDYVNFNAVKHRYVTEPYKWENSSFHEYVKRGIYTQEKEFKGDLVVRGSEYD